MQSFNPTEDCNYHMYDYEGDNCNGVEWTRTTGTQYMKEPAYAYS